MRGVIRDAAVPTGFRPFDLTITVENQTDLVALWGRFNMSGEVLAPAAQAAAIRGPKGPFSRSFVEQLEIDPAGKKDIYKLLTQKLKDAGIARR